MNDSGTTVASGRDQVRQDLASAVARSAQRQVRMIARVETGAMHAEWRGREATADGDVSTSAGYDEFWIEDGLIRRQRGVLHPLSFQAEEDVAPINATRQAAGGGGPTGAALLPRNTRPSRLYSISKPPSSPEGCCWTKV